jgi:uncharacterized protein YbcI
MKLAHPGYLAPGMSVDVQIAEAMAGLHAEFYGHPPGSSRAIVAEDVVVVVMEQTFTRAERTMIERGEVEEIQNIRRRFQRVMAEDFHSVVENATGRDVRSFVSDTDVNEGLSIEIFLLAGTKTDMSEYEYGPGGERPAG